MAIDLAPHGIRVNSIGPTFIDTPLTRPFFENVAFHGMVLRQDQARPAGHGGGPDGRRRVPGLRRRGADHRHVAVVDGGWTAE